jgi:hypothetical protein
MEVPVKPRRPPSPPLIGIVFSASFFVFCFERDPHGLFLRLFQKAKLLLSFYLSDAELLEIRSFLISPANVPRTFLATLELGRG